MKLSEAAVVGADEIDPHFVTLNSRVVFRVDSGPVDTRIVINGEEDSLVGMTILIRVPRGLALLGARAGQDVVATRRDGSIENISVEEVAFQPEAQRRNTDSNERSMKANAHLGASGSVAPLRRRAVWSPRIVRASGELIRVPRPSEWRR
jgi:regulator of nucleoside diphosphate kinase